MVSFRNIPFISIAVMLGCIVSYLRMTKYMKTENIYEAAIKCGAVYTPSILEEKQYWRLLTGGFVHFSVLHLLCSCYVLFSLGTSLEAVFGHLLYAILLLGSVVIGNLFTVFMKSDISVSGGLSGGLYGLIAAELTIFCIVYGPSAVFQSPSVLSTVLVNLMMNFFPGVNWRAHLGGTCMGILFITLIMRIL